MYQVDFDFAIQKINKIITHVFSILVLVSCLSIDIVINASNITILHILVTGVSVFQFYIVIQLFTSIGNNNNIISTDIITLGKRYKISKFKYFIYNKLLNELIRYDICKSIKGLNGNIYSKALKKDTFDVTYLCWRQQLHLLN